MGWSIPAVAAGAEPLLAIPPLPLARALAELARQGGIAIGADGHLPDLACPPVNGRMEPGRALARLLAGSGLAARQVAPGVWRIEPARARKGRPAVPPPQTGAEAIVVAASKQNLHSEDVAQALSMMTLPLPGAAQAQSGTADVAAAIDGLVLTAQGPGRNRMFIGGVADSPFNGASQSPVAVYIDDTRLTYAAPDPDLRLVDVHHVEVLKGPQGALYGTGVLGGIYRIVTNQPDPDHAAASISAGLGAVVGGGTGPSGSGMLNLPVLKGTGAVRLVAYASQEPGWIDTGTRQDSNTTRVAGARGALALVAGAWRVDAVGMGQWINDADSQYVYAAGARSRPAQAAEPHDNDLLHSALRVEGPVGAARLVATSGYTWHNVRDQLDAGVGATALGLADPALFFDTRAYRLWDSELRLSGRWRGMRWLAGLDHLEARQDEDRSLAGTGGESLLIDHAQRVSYETGLFGHLSIPLTGRLDVEAGGRLFHDDFRSTRAAGGQTALLRTHSDGFTPEAALLWRVSEGRSLFLRVGSAFRQGGLGVQDSGQVGTYPGDRLTTFSAGGHQRWGAGGQISLSTSLTLWDDMQSDMLLPNGLIETRTAGQARIVGLTLAARRTLGQGWVLEGGGTVQSARLVRNALGIALEDTRLPAIPDYSWRLAAERRWPWGAAKAHLRLGLNGTGPSRLSFQPGIDRRMGDVLDSRIEAGLDWPRNRVLLAISNPLARSGDMFAYGTPLRAAVAQFTPQKPPTFSLSFSRDF